MAEVNAGQPHSSFLLAHGPTLYVNVGFDLDYRPGFERPALPDSPVPALIDTGATYSCIDSALAEDLDLPIIGRAKVAGAHGIGEVNEHLAQIYVPGLGLTIHGAFDGVHLRAGGMPHDVLLGRSFLQRVTMHYEGATGKVVISA